MCCMPKYQTNIHIQKFDTYIYMYAYTPSFSFFFFRIQHYYDKEQELNELKTDDDAIRRRKTKKNTKSSRKRIV